MSTSAPREGGQWAPAEAGERSVVGAIMDIALIYLDSCRRDARLMFDGLKIEFDLVYLINRGVGHLDLQSFIYPASETR